MNPIDNNGHRERLRKKFMDNGPNTLADYEFLELILMRAIPRCDVKPMAKSLMSKFGTLSRVLTADSSELMEVKGIKESTISLFKIIIVAGQKMAEEKLKTGPVLNDFIKLLDYGQMTLGHESIEKFAVVYLDAKLRVIKCEIVQTGTVNHVPVFPREILKRAINLNALSVILMHNHPSGDATPSGADIRATQEIKKCLNAANIVVNEHLILGRGGACFSFQSQGVL